MLDNSIDNVVQTIFAECDKDKTNTVRVVEVVKFILPYLQANLSELSELEEALKKNAGDSGVISRSLFIETMIHWTSKYKDCTGQLEDSFEGIFPGRKSDINEKSFVHSTPRTSLGVLNQEFPLIQEQLNISSASCPDVQLNKTIFEDRIKDLEHANWKLTKTLRRHKAQEQFCDDQIECLKRELDLMTNKYNLAQKLIENLNKLEVNKENSTIVNSDVENSQIELENKYKSLRKDYDLVKVEFTKQIDKLELEKLELEKTNVDLENKITTSNAKIKAMETEIAEQNNDLVGQRTECINLIAANHELSVNVKELTTIVETFRSQQKVMQGKLRKSLCYNDKLQTSFNALQAIKAMGKYSKSKQKENTSKYTEINQKPIQEIPFNTKDHGIVPKFVSKELLNITESPPIMYVINKTPPGTKSINSSFDYLEVSCEEESKFCHVDPRSPHMSLQTEMQEAILCCCTEIKQSCEYKIFILEEEVKTQTRDKEKLHQKVIEYTKLVQNLENENTRNVSTIRNFEIIVQSLKDKVKTKENDMFSIISSRSINQPSPEKRRDTFDKLKMKIAKYEHWFDVKQEEMNHVKTSQEVYKNRLAENEQLINNLYKNNASITILISSMNQDLQGEVRNFIEVCHDDISKIPKVMELFQSVIGEAHDEFPDLPTEVLDFSNRISSITDMLRILADSKLELNDIISAFQSGLNRSGPCAINVQSKRLKCDSPDSPSNNPQIFSSKNHTDGTVLAEAKETLEPINVNQNTNNEQALHLKTEELISIQTKDIATQTEYSGKRSNHTALPSIIILLSVLYLLYEARTVEYRNNHTM